MATNIYQFYYDFITKEQTSTESSEYTPIYVEDEDGNKITKEESIVSDLRKNIFLQIDGFSKANSISIQTIPGIKFLINDTGGWVKIGSSGKYHIENNNITSLKFNYDSILELLNNQRAHLIVDIEYEEE